MSAFFVFGRDRSQPLPMRMPAARTRGAAEDDLEDGPQEGRFHIFILDEGDRPQFEEDDDGRDDGGRPEMRDKIGQRMPETAQCRHDARGKAPLQRRARPDSLPSSCAASVKPIEMPAPTEADRPIRNVCQVSCVAKAAANMGASVETDPSIRPARPAGHK